MILGEFLMNEKQDNHSLVPDSEEGRAEESENNHSEDFDRWLEVRSRELDLEREELDIRRHETAEHLKHATELLKIEAIDRNGQREADDRRHKRNTIFGVILILLLISFGAFLVLMKHSDLLDKLISFLVILFGGYGWGYHQGRKSRSGEE